MASIKCPNCGEYQAIPLEELGPGCVGGPALLLGYLGGAIAHARLDDGAISILVLGLGIGVPALLGMFILYLGNLYPVRCEHCGYAGKSRQKTSRQTRGF